MWAVGLFLIGLAPIVAAPFYGFHDWPDFWSAGSLVGTADLVDPVRLARWQVDHGLPPVYFPYPPAVAFLLWPLARLPLDQSFWVHTALMLGCAVAAGRLAARVFGLDRSVAILACLAWAPVTGAIVIGQNTPLALLLAMIVIDAVVGGSRLRAGLGAAALLYKPTLALPLAGLLLVRGWWRSLVLVAIGVAAWYLVGIPAAAGDVGWPGHWVEAVRAWLANDTIQNADKAVSLPTLLTRLAVPDWVPLAAGLVLGLAAVPRLARAPIREAAAGACLIGVAASPHAWSYEAALLMPAIWWALAGGISEPWRTRLIVGAYVLAPLWLVSPQTGISAVAIIVLVAAAIWLSGALRGDVRETAPAAGVDHT